jgi:hypothetical protein
MRLLEHSKAWLAVCRSKCSKLSAPCLLGLVSFCPMGRIHLLRLAQLRVWRMARLINSVTLSLTIVFGLPCRAIKLSSSRATRRPQIEVSAMRAMGPGIPNVALALSLNFRNQHPSTATD